MAKKKIKAGRPPLFTPGKRKIYLDKLRETGEKALARLEAGMKYSTVYMHAESHPAFREAEEEALRLYRAEKIAAEIHRRGIDGVQEPIYWQGVVVGWVTKYSDRLLELHAKRHIPEYREKVSVDSHVTGAVNLLADLRDLPKDIRFRLRALIKEALEREKEPMDED